MKPLAIDLFCGLGGWTDGLLAEGWRVVGFDIERHRYPARALPDAQSRKVMADGVDFNNPAIGDSRNRSFNYANQCAVRDAPLTGGWDEYPGQLVLQDVLTLHGKQFKDAALIVASPPCQEYSYMAMPWSRAKAIAAEYRSGVRDVAKLTALFDACFRIQREAIEAAGHFIPLVVENVRGAIPWVGRSRWNFGSFHLWGDVPALMPMASARKVLNKYSGNGSWVSETGVDWRDPSNVGTHAAREGRKTTITSGGWFNDNPDRRKESISWASSKSNARKAASAAIAKIPLPLSQHIARTYRP